MISEKLIKELQEIIKTRYGVDLSHADASIIGNDLVEAFDVLAQIDFREKYEKD
jgi:hypothetical protein